MFGLVTDGPGGVDREGGGGIGIGFVGWVGWARVWALVLIGRGRGRGDAVVPPFEAGWVRVGRGGHYRKGSPGDVCRAMLGIEGGGK